jgi:hypothetical protein
VTNNQAQKIAWDSCVVIDSLQKTPGRYVHIRPLILDAEADKLIVVVSAMAIVETIRVDGHAPPADLKIIEDFFDNPWVHPEAAGVKIAKIARDVRRAHKVDGIDAVHIATALATDAPVFLTTDGVAKKKKTPLLPLDNLISIDGKPALRIRTPEQHQKVLFAAAAPLLAMKGTPTPPTPSAPQPTQPPQP